MERDVANGCRYAGNAKGHYESWFQRANHPTECQAFWVRYTIFVPKGRPELATGELWAIYFDGEAGEITAVKELVPWDACSFAERGLDVNIGDARLDGGGLAGQAKSLGHELGWELSYTSPVEPLLLLPEKLYTAPFPKAKALVGSPLARYTGTVIVDGKTLVIDDWLGSQNHNWGVKHTDRYAWGQVAGFDGAEDSFLEVSTAQVDLGPISTPWLSPMVLRHEGREYRLNGMLTAAKANGKYDFFEWRFSSTHKGTTISGSIEARKEDFVALPYDNPPGGRKTCLNSKIARCSVTLYRTGKPAVTLQSANRAAFEILTDRVDHGVPRLAV